MIELQALNIAQFVIGSLGLCLLAIVVVAAFCVAMARVYAFACLIFKPRRP